MTPGISLRPVPSTAHTYTWPAVETEVIAVGAQEALYVHRAGEQVPLLVLKRAQILGADLGPRLDLGDVDPSAHSRLAQRRSDVRHGRKAIEAPSAAPTRALQ